MPATRSVDTNERRAGRDLLGLLCAVYGLGTAPAMTVRADGGTVRVVDKPVGSYRVTVVTDPSPLLTGTADVSVVVTEADGAAAPDATVDVAATPPGDRTATQHFPATHAQATNKRYYAANVPISSAGIWSFTVHVAGTKGEGDVQFVADVSVAIA